MKYIKYNIGWISWGIFIYILISLPGNNIPDNIFFKYIPFADKLVHAFLFGIFILLLNNSLLKQCRIKYQYLILLLALLLSILYAGITELLQKKFFIERTADIMDFFADVTGIIIAELLYIKRNKLKITFNRKL